MDEAWADSLDRRSAAMKVELTDTRLAASWVATKVVLTAAMTDKQRAGDLEMKLDSQSAGAKVVSWDRHLEFV